MRGIKFLGRIVLIILQFSKCLHYWRCATHFVDGKHVKCIHYASGPSSFSARFCIVEHRRTVYGEVKGRSEGSERIVETYARHLLMNYTHCLLTGFLSEVSDCMIVVIHCVSE